jgi:hypothetical protein
MNGQYRLMPIYASNPCGPQGLDYPINFVAMTDGLESQQ